MYVVTAVPVPVGPGLADDSGRCRSATAIALVTLKISLLMTSWYAQTGIDVPTGIGFGYLTIVSTASRLS